MTACWSDPRVRRTPASCSLRAGPLKDAADWLQTYRRFWDDSLDRLDGYLRELQGKGKPHGRKP